MMKLAVVKQSVCKIKVEKINYKLPRDRGDVTMLLIVMCTH